MKLSKKNIFSEQENSLPEGADSFERFYKNYHSRIKHSLQSYFSDLDYRVASEHSMDADDLVFVRKIDDVVSSNLANEHFKVTDLCRALAVSQSFLFRRLKNITGNTPGKYILLYKLHKAREMLEHSRKTVGAIALDTGFANQSHFTRAFKKEYKCSPLRYREQYFERNNQKSD